MVYDSRVRPVQMRYFILLASIALGAYAATSLATAVAVSAWSRSLRRRVAGRPAAERARILAAVRLLPIAVGALCTILFVSAFIRYEPRDTVEAPGLLLIVFAMLSVVLVAAALVRLLSSFKASATCASLLRECSRRLPREDGQRIWIIESRYPVAAVTGLFRSRLLLSTRIVSECTPSELEAVIRHEAAHVRRRDNFVRAAMHVLPDPLLPLGAGRALQADWAAAAEEAADDEAAGPQVESRTELAATLLRVARMADGPPPRWMPALAFYEGTNLEHRVRRLLCAGSRGTRASVGRIAASTAAMLTALLVFTDVSQELHGLMELAVRYLP